MRTRFFQCLSIAVTLLVSAAAGAEAGHVFKPLTPEQVQSIDASLPSKPTAKPTKAHRLLVFYLTEGFVHDSIPFANTALQRMGERTGAFTAEFSDDMSVFTPERLARFDAILLNNTTRLAFANPTHRAALLEFVAKGGGFVGIHAATDNFHDWPAGQALIGGTFFNHPWVSTDTVAVKIDDPTHPVVAAFNGKPFLIRDEIYQITGPYSRQSQQVLLSLDMAQPLNGKRENQFARRDADFPIAWVRTHGRGRVFYTSLGHNPEIYSNPQLLRHYLDGIQFVLGDLPYPN